jgi:glyceraldehyde 3-phosphate dehydrogenase
MTIRVGINGFGRIGRAFVRRAMERGDLEVVAVNDVTDARTLAHLLEFDSTYGRLGHAVRYGPDSLTVDGRTIAVQSSRDPAAIDWAAFGASVVIESTGKFRAREDAATHLKGGARKVLISAPGKDADLTVVMGVNDAEYDPQRHDVISAASCTSNCVVPMVKVLDDAFGLTEGFMTTIHAYTGDQMLLDGPHKDLRRARSAAANIVPTSTGAARTAGVVIPGLHGKLDGILRYSTNSIVSRDIIGDPASCVFDSALTQAGGSLVKVFGWYDNEWGYTCRLADLAALVGAPFRQGED